MPIDYNVLRDSQDADVQDLINKNSFDIEDKRKGLNNRFINSVLPGQSGDLSQRASFDDLGTGFNDRIKSNLLTQQNDRWTNRPIIIVTSTQKEFSLDCTYERPK